MTRLALLTLAVIAGCATPPPHVDYRRLSDRPAGDGGVPFQLTDTRLVVGLVPPDPANASDPVPPVSLDPVTVDCDIAGCYMPGTRGVSRKPLRLAIAAVPIPFAGTIMTIDPRRRGLVTTALAPTYYANSLRLKTLSVEVRDHRVEAINAVGGIVRGIVSAAGQAGMSNDEGVAATVALRLPVVVDLRDAVTALDTNTPLPGNVVQWEMAAAFLDRPGRPGLGYLPRGDAATVHQGMVTSACRRFVLSLRSGMIGLDFSTIVADPDWLIAIPLPSKGTLSFHTLCGADVAAQPIDEIGADKIAAAFVANVEAIGVAAK